MGDHTEALQVDFDPNEISFAQVADLFWRSHNPCFSRGGRQYMSAIWFHGESQEHELQNMANTIAQSKGEIVTPMEPVQEFYLAEDYHQKYRLQRHSNLMHQFRAWYPEFSDFNDSTAAARLNGILGNRHQKAVAKLVADEIGQYGFEPDLLADLVR